MPRDSDNNSSGSESSESESESSDSESDLSEGAVSSRDKKKSLKSAQLENAKLKKELKQLKLAANSKLAEAQNINPRHKPKEVVSEKLVVFNNDIALYGRKYSLMIGPWVDNNIFVNIVGRPNVDPFGDARFDKKNKKAMQNGELAELYDFLPPILHDPLQNHSRFSRMFRHHLQNTRCNGVLAVRTKAGLIFDLKQAYFETSFDRASVPELQRLLKNPPNEEYATLAPILFPNGQYDLTKKTLFRNVALPRIIKTLLCGKSSTTSDKSISKPQTLAELWGVTNVTPGLIAFSAVLARFMLSPDGELRRIGGKTGISWNGEFLKYKKLLVVKSKRMEDLFKFFDDIVFGSSSKANVQIEEPDYNSEELDDALQAFMDDSVEDVPTSLIKSLTITPHRDDPLDPPALESPPGLTKRVTSSTGTDLPEDADGLEEPEILETRRTGGGSGTIIDIDDAGEDSAQDTVEPERARRVKKGASATPGTIDDDANSEDTRQQSDKPVSKKKSKKTSATTDINENGEGVRQQSEKPISKKKKSPATTVLDEVSEGTVKVSKQKRAVTSRVVSKSATRKSRRGANVADSEEPHDE